MVSRVPEYDFRRFAYQVTIPLGYYTVSAASAEKRNSLNKKLADAKKPPFKG
jgi:hypothetical protein